MKSRPTSCRSIGGEKPNVYVKEEQFTPGCPQCRFRGVERRLFLLSVLTVGNIYSSFRFGASIIFGSDSKGSCSRWQQGLSGRRFPGLTVMENTPEMGAFLKKDRENQAEESLPRL